MMRNSDYKPPQINEKNRILLRKAHQYLVQNPNGDVHGFVNHVHQNCAQFSNRKEKYWRKDAAKSLKYIHFAIARGWDLPGLTATDDSEADLSDEDYVPEPPEYRSSHNEASLRRIRETREAAAAAAAAAASTAAAESVSDADDADESQSARPMRPPPSKRRRLRRSAGGGGGEDASPSERKSLASRLIEDMDLEFSVPTLDTEALFKDLLHAELMSLCRIAIAALSCPASLITEELQGCFLVGSPKSGKTTLVRAMASLAGVPLCELQLDSFAGKSADVAAGMWQATLAKAAAAQPCVLLLHGVDRLSAALDANKPMAACRRALLNCLSLHAGCRVLLVGETSAALTDMDDGLRCAFRKVARLGLLDRGQRAACLRQLFASAGVRLVPDAGAVLDACALKTVGFNVGDLKQLAREAVEDAHVCRRVPPPLSSSLPTSAGDGGGGSGGGLDYISRVMREFGAVVAGTESAAAAAAATTAPEPIELDANQLEAAFDRVLPLAKQKPHFIRIPDVSWADIGGCHEAKREIRQTFMSLVLDPEGAEAIGQKADGLLLVGDPGCGKTLLAKALSNEAGLNFMSVKGPEIFDKYLGESERAIRVLFENARACQPCLVFFDEIDAVCAHRGSDTGAHSTVVNQLLTLLDGLEGRGQVFVMAATNRPDLIDQAIRRPGRLGKTVVVRKPQSPEERLEVLTALTRTKPPFGEDRAAALARVASDERCRGLSGAELSQLVEEAKLNARLNAGRRYVIGEDFEVALAALPDRRA